MAQRGPVWSHPVPIVWQVAHGIAANEFVELAPGRRTPRVAALPLEPAFVVRAAQPPARATAEDQKADVALAYVIEDEGVQLEPEGERVAVQSDSRLRAVGIGVPSIVQAHEDEGRHHRRLVQR